MSGGPAQGAEEDPGSLPFNPQQCVAYHIINNSKLGIRAYMEFYVAALFFFIYTLHFFTNLIPNPFYLTICRMIYVFALICETAFYQTALSQIREVYFSAPNDKWNWNMVCQDTEGLGDLTWESGYSEIERQRGVVTNPSAGSRDGGDIASGLFEDTHRYSQPVNGLVLTSWDSPETSTCGAYMLYFNAPFYALASRLWYESAWLRTIVALSYVCVFIFSFGCSACKKDNKDDEREKRDAMQSLHQQKLKYGLYEQFFFLFVEVMYNLLFTVLVSFVGISVLWFYWAESVDPIEFSYLSAGVCDDVAGYLRSDALASTGLKCMQEVVYSKEANDRGDYFVVYQSVLIFYVLTVVESIHFVEGHDREYNKNKMVWDTRFRVLAGVVLLLECILFLGGIMLVIGSDVEWTRENGPLENNYPSADRLNNLSVSSLGLRIAFLGVYAIGYLIVAGTCAMRMREEYELEQELKEKDPEKQGYYEEKTVLNWWDKTCLNPKNFKGGSNKTHPAPSAAY